MNRLKGLLYRILFELLKSEGKRESSIKNALIFHPGNLGNLVAFIPVLYNLKKEKIQVILVVEYDSPFLQFLHKKKLVDEFLCYKPKSFLEKMQFLISFRERKFDLLLSNYMNRYRSIQIPLALLSKIPIRVGHTSTESWQNPIDYIYNIKVPFNPLKHEIQSNLDLLRAIGLSDEVPYPLIQIDSSKREKDIICVHPGSSINLKWKRWDERRFASVVAYIVKNFKKEVYLLGTDDDRDSVEKVIYYLNKFVPQQMSRVKNLCSQLSFDETIETLFNCKVLISNDSGLSKLAMALGVKSIVIWGPTNYFKNKIWDRRLGIDLRIPLKCSPCYTLGDTSKAQNCPNRACLLGITPKMVINALNKILEQ